MRHCPGEQPFVTLAEHSPDVIFRLDHARHFMYINPAIERLVGRLPADFLGKTGPEAGLPESWWQALEKLCDEALSCGKPQEQEFTETTSEGIRYLTLRIIPESAPAGAEPCLLGVICDQTQRRRAEAAVHSMARFPEENPAPVLRLSGEGTLLYRNAPAAALLEALGWEAGQPVPEELLTPVRVALKAGTTLEFELLTPTGRIFSFILVAVPGEVYANLYGREITERKRTEEALRQSEQEFRALFELSSVGLAQAEPASGRFRRVNQRFCQITGYTADELVRKTFTEITHPEDRVRDREIFYQTLERGGTAWSIEKRYRRKNGDVVWVHVSGAILRDTAGRAYRTLASILEITERKQAEQALRERENELRLIMDATPALISYIDAEYRYRRVNQSYERWFGQPAQTIQGRHVREVLGEATWQRVQPYMAQALAGETVTYERELPYREGGPRWVHVTYTPDYDQAGQVGGFVVHVMDVQERHQAEQALRESEARLREADRRKDEFLALLAHELRNPLAPIRNAVAILQRTGPLEPQLQWCREVIARQVSHMARLLDDLLDISRITRGKLHLYKEPVELRAVIQQALETSRPVIDAQGHQFTVSMPTEPLWLEADPVRLAQVFSNLLNNAAKFTEPGGQLGLSIAPHGAEVTVIIRDTGMGIAPEQLSRLFEPFTQADCSLSRSHGGLGIGLTLVRQLVTLHGGHVEARSEGLGKGSEFIVVLPLASAD